MGALLAFLGGRGTWVLFSGIFIGLAFPGLAALARPLLAPAVALMLLTTLLRVDWHTMAEVLRRPVLVSALILWLMLLSPVLVWLILGGVDLPTSLESGIVLMAAGPPILGATSIAILLGLDAALAVVVGLICTLLAPFTVPPLALLLLGLELDIGLADFMLRLGLLVGGAFLGAAIIRRLAGSSRIADYGRHLDGVVVLTMLVFAVAIMDGVTATLLREPATVLLWLVAAFVANPALQILGAALAWKIGRRQSLTVGLVSGNCNMGLLLAALPAGSDPGVALYFAIAQMPMYMLPALLLPIYRRLLTRVDPSNE